MKPVTRRIVATLLFIANIVLSVLYPWYLALWLGMVAVGFGIDIYRHGSNAIKVNIDTFKALFSK